MKKVNNIKPKVAIIYVRVSSQEQVLGYSLENQERICREFATKGGYEVLKVFTEKGESAKTAERTELQLMLRFCEKNKNQIGKLIVYKVDRLSRSTADYLYLKVFFNRLGISVVSATENFENNPSGILHETILSAFAEFDNNVRSQRTIEGMKARLLSGNWSTIAPWGYVNTINKAGNKTITPHPEKAPIVRMLFKEYSTGKYTFKELADKVNKLGLKSLHGKRFHKQLVAKIIKNPIYKGQICFPKWNISVKGNHEALINEGLFDDAESAKNKSAGGKLPRNKDDPLFPLRGIKCGSCGKNISGGKTKGRHQYYYYYGCYCYECSKRTAIKKEDLENDFTMFLKELTPDNDFIEILKEAIKIAYKEEFESTTSTKIKLESKISEKKDKKDKLLDLSLAGKLKDEDFTPAFEKVKFEISELEKSVNSIFIPELELENVINSSLEFLKHLPEEWKSLDVKDLRVLRNLIFPKNIEYSYPGIKTAELSPVYKLKSQFGDDKNLKVTPRGIEPRF